MNLLDESFQNKEEKKGNATKTAILIAIVLVIITICAIIATMIYIKRNTFRVSIDGVYKNDIKSILEFEKDNDGNEIIYVPIKQIAEQLGYEAFNGEYSNKSEANNKCYIQCEQEIANFELGSDKIYKLDRTANTENYEYVYSKKPVKAIGGVLYASSDAIEKAFNISFEYNANKKTITIYTLPYLVQAYSSYVLDLGYANISEKFANQKGILKSMIVVEKNNGSTKVKGVIDTDGNTILEPKYEDIVYLPNVGNGTDFLVTSNGKVGVMTSDSSNNGKTKIDIAYSDIELLDIDAELYLVKGENGKYGVIDFTGTKKIVAENDKIGIDASKFKDNDIKNSYILADNLIPAEKDKKWALYDKTGKKLTEYEYDSIGYIASNNKNILNLLVIPDYNVLIAGIGDRYTLINNLGKDLLPNIIMDDIYLEISGGEKRYLISANNNIYNAIELLEGIGAKKQNSKTEDSNEEQNNVVNENKTEVKDQNDNKENENRNEEQENTENESNEELLYSTGYSFEFGNRYVRIYQNGEIHVGMENEESEEEINYEYLKSLNEEEISSLREKIDDGSSKEEIDEYLMDFIREIEE